MLKVIRFDETKAKEQAVAPSSGKRDRLLDKMGDLDADDGTDASKTADLQEDVDKKLREYIGEQTEWVLAKVRSDNV